MILRKLAESIRQQNWFTVLVEILIVVIGIFVGLQVDDWNRTRIQLSEESEYLTRLSDDLNESIEGTKFDIAWMSKSATLGNQVARSLETCSLADEQKNDLLALDTGSYKDELKDKEHRIILETLARCQGKRKEVAETLGISPRTLRYKLAQMRDLGISLPA